MRVSLKSNTASGVATRRSKDVVRSREEVFSGNNKVEMKVTSATYGVGSRLLWTERPRRGEH